MNRMGVQTPSVSFFKAILFQDVVFWFLTPCRNEVYLSQMCFHGVKVDWVKYGRLNSNKANPDGTFRDVSYCINNSALQNLV